MFEGRLGHLTREGGTVQNTNTSGSSHLASGQQLDYLDGWRGIAISLLLVGHFFPYWQLKFCGTAGVHFFFVLSGFLMAKQLFLHETPLPTFYKRRISRIFPALYAFIAITIISYLIAGLPVSWGTALGATALIRNYYPVGFGNALPFDHIWSLSVEEHSYIVLSALVIFFPSKIERQRIALGMLSFCCIIMAAVYTIKFSGPALYREKLIHTEVAAFGIFFSGFLLLCLRNGINRSIPPFVFYTLPIIAIVTYSTSAPPAVTMVVGLVSLALTVNILHKAPEWMLRALSLPALRKLGLWSYSLYLWQQPFYALKNKGLISTSAAFLLALLAGVLSYYLIEAPARNYLNSTWARKNKPENATPFISDALLAVRKNEHDDVDREVMPRSVP